MHIETRFINKTMGEFNLGYQTHDLNQMGHSDSQQKLGRLGIPIDMTGLKFLDFGCNEGFFSGIALQRGASYSIGVDVNPKSIEVARSLYPSVDFRCQDWLETDVSDMDVILLSSALHYSSDPLSILTKISTMMAPNALFILEAGAIDDKGTNLVAMRVGRSFGSCVFPTIPTLEKMLSTAGFESRMIGPSVNQSGDPVPRFVWHCRKRIKHVIFVKGKSSTGKTTLAISIQKSESFDVLSTDSLLGHLFSQNLNFPYNPPLFKQIEIIMDSVMKSGAKSIWERLHIVANELIKNGFAENLVDLILDQFSFSIATTILIEGHLLTFDEIFSPLSQRLKDKGIFVSVLETGLGFHSKKYSQASTAF